MCSFFFKQKTAYEIKECDWSSDVCSSDLLSGLKNDGIIKIQTHGIEIADRKFLEKLSYAG